jgi:hypothetical protein
MPQLAKRLGLDLSNAFAGHCEQLPNFFESVPLTPFRYGMKCGAAMLMNSRVVITLVCFQNFGKCRRLPVIR